MNRHELTDAAWRRLAPLLPPQRPAVGRPAPGPSDDHQCPVLAGQTGAPWRDLPERYGPWRTAATRFYRWTRSGLWRRILAELQRQGDAAGKIDWSVHMVDGTSVRAHRHAAGAKGGRQARRSAALETASAASSTCAASEVAGRIAFVLTAGERHEQTAFEPLMTAAAVKRPGRGRPRSRPRWLLGDRGYTGYRVRDHLRPRGIAAIIPQLRIETRPRLMDWQTYRERKVVERLVGRLKEHRRLATRYDKLASSYLEFVHLAAILMWL